jgi:hypothetical protein
MFQNFAIMLLHLRFTRCWALEVPPFFARWETQNENNCHSNFYIIQVILITIIHIEERSPTTQFLKSVRWIDLQIIFDLKIIQHTITLSAKRDPGRFYFSFFS